jgi:hypothetical protein
LANDDNRSLTQLLRELYFSWTGIVFLIMALVSVLMLVASAETHGTVSQFWLAVGSAVLASTGYSFVQTLLTTRQFNRFLSGTIQDDIRKEITKSTDEAMQIFRSARGRYLPSKTYPAHMSMDPAFNRDLNDSLSHSEHYVFRGMSARYAVARLALLDAVPRDIRLIVADPTRPDAVNFRARHEAYSGDEQAFDRAKQEILDGIHMSIAGAYLTRRKFDHLEFHFTALPHVDRVEICDDDIYITRFSESSGERATFPVTARFEHDSLLYQMFNSDCGSLVSSPYLPRLEIPGGLSQSDFIARLASLGMELSPER